MDEFENLCEELLRLPAAGEKGVEGLVAHALSSLTLRSFRLARSGRQHGRDGATTPGPFDIFFEVKAYSNTPPSTEDLLAKFFSAIASHKPNLDVWILAATTAINENSISELKELADQHSITVLLADWSEHPMPVLAALLAATSESTKEWFEHHPSGPDVNRVSEALEEIICHPAYNSVIAEITGELTAPTTGWQTAKQKNEEWLMAQFSNRSSARRAFGQYLSPKDEASHPVERVELNARLSEAMLSASEEPALVAVLGDEGTGKTWLAATAWLSIENRPLLLLATSDIVCGEKELQDPLSLLAVVLDWQTGGRGNPENIQRWRRRLDNWRRYDMQGAPRVILVLDGLNERESKKWVRLIDRLTDTASDIGLRIVVTSRKAFFARNIEPSLAGYSVKKIDVTPFSDAEMRAALAPLSPAEKAFLDNYALQTDSVSLPAIDRLAIMLLIGRPLEAFVETIVAWQLAGSVMQRIFRKYDEMAWLIRLNPMEFQKTADRLVEIAAGLEKQNPSKTGLWAIKAIYQLTGRPQDAVEAHRISTAHGLETTSYQWRRVETFCATDPLDPLSPSPDNIAQAVAQIEGIDIEHLNASMFMHMNDHDLESLTPALARFSPKPLVDKLRQAARHVSERNGIPLRQMAWALSKFTALFTDAEVSEVQKAFDRIAAGEVVVSQDDRRVTQKLLLALLPHLEGEKQLDLLLRLPLDDPELIELQAHFKGMSPEAFEAYLVKESRNGNHPSGLRRVLYFAMTGKVALTDMARKIVIDCYQHEGASVRACAMEVAAMLEDRQALQALAVSSWSAQTAEAKFMEAHYGSHALAAVIGRVDDVATLNRFAPEWQCAIVGKLEGEALVAFSQGLKERVRLGLGLPSDLAPSVDLERNIQSVQEATRDYPLFTARERVEPQDLRSQLNEISGSAEVREERWKEQYERNHSATNAYLEALRAYGLRELADPAYGMEIRALSERDRVTFLEAVELLDQAEERHLGAVNNLALCLATVLSQTDPSTAARLFAKLEGVHPHVTVVISKAKIPFDHLALWEAADCSEVSALRRGRLRTARNDQELATEALAAMHAKKHELLLSEICALLQSDHPADLARGITLAGFCDVDERIQPLFATTRFGNGFLFEAAARGCAAYERNQWARHWFAAAHTATDTESYWRYSELMVASADARCVLWFPSDLDDAGEPFARFHAFLYPRLQRCFDKKRDKRKDTLFGFKLPSDAFLSKWSYWRRQAVQKS